MSLHNLCCPQISCSNIKGNNVVALRRSFQSSLISNLVIKSNLRIKDSATEDDHGKNSTVSLSCCNHIGSGSSTEDYGGSPIASPAVPDVSDVITEGLFEEMFPYRNDRRCPAKGFYTYEAFLASAKRFPAFGNSGTMEARRRELAAFFGQTSHETRGVWRDAPGEGYEWGYCYNSEVKPRSEYCVESKEWPAVTGQKYYGRGPIQLTFNWNYGQVGKYLGLDLLSNPDLVASDAVVSFSAALWFWMTPQDNKPSCHDVILGAWEPNEADLAVNRRPGYGTLTNIINPGECGHGADKRVASRIAFYERYCRMLGVSPGDNLDCYDQCRF